MTPEHTMLHDDPLPEYVTCTVDTQPTDSWLCRCGLVNTGLQCIDPACGVRWSQVHGRRRERLATGERWR